MKMPLRLLAIATISLTLVSYTKAGDLSKEEQALVSKGALWKCTSPTNTVAISSLTFPKQIRERKEPKKSRKIHRRSCVLFLEVKMQSRRGTKAAAWRSVTTLRLKLTNSFSRKAGTVPRPLFHPVLRRAR